MNSLGRSSLFHDIRLSVGLLRQRDRLVLFVMAGIQSSLSVMDVIGVLALGTAAALGAAALTPNNPSALMGGFLSRILPATPDPLQTAVLLSVVAAAVLLLKSVLSAVMTQRLLRFLAHSQADVSDRMTAKLFEGSLLLVQGMSTQQVTYALGQGANMATVVLLGQSVLAIAEVCVLTVLAILLFIINPAVASAALVFFVILGLLMQTFLGRWSSGLGTSIARSEIDLTQCTQEALQAFREIIIANRDSHYLKRFHRLRLEAAENNGRVQFLGQIPKYTLESALVIGIAMLAGYALIAPNKVAAATTLVVFLAAGTRMIPALLRLQGAILQIRESAGRAESTFALAQDLKLDDSVEIRSTKQPEHTIAKQFGTEHTQSLRPQIVVTNVSFTYPGATEPAVLDLSLAIKPGTSTALVGRSGAGKSTIADLLLGLLTPDTGVVLMDGMSPSSTIHKWPGAVSYVPQQTSLANASVAENLALGLPRSEIDDDRCWESLGRAHLDDLVRSLPAGLDTEIGERGMRLSGGQRQRLGLARALFTQPLILIMDEATSALDAETEQLVSDSLVNLEGQVTVVTIAHRLATVQHSDQVVFLDHGRVLSIGSFSEVRASVPNFDRQARLLGM